VHSDTSRDTASAILNCCHMYSAARMTWRILQSYNMAQFSGL
jgi:hypothetical protein